MKDDLKDKLRELVNQGVRLQIAMHKEQGYLSEGQEEIIKDFKLSFSEGYQAWYSESKELVRQVLPNRLDDFSSLYKSTDKRKGATYENYTVFDYLLNLTRRIGLDTVVSPDAAIPKFTQQLLILKSAYELIDSRLIDLTQVLQADLFDSEIEAARHLNKNGFTRAAGAMAGVVIESHLQQVCRDHNIKITKKNPGINDLAQLLKDSSIIDTPQWRGIQQMADIRNLCDHKKLSEPTKDQITELIDGTAKIIKTVF
ncbi:MAG: hypothetical protein WBK76_05060 [Candidatus Saccharimonadales bacterium]|nr:hypothetical protein [Patescibacteria group bacterium]